MGNVKGTHVDNFSIDNCTETCNSNKILSLTTKDDDDEGTSDPIDIQSENSSKIWTRKKRRAPLFCSCRLILSIMSCLGLMNLYTLRFNFNVALTLMVWHENDPQIYREKLTKLPRLYSVSMLINKTTKKPTGMNLQNATSLYPIHSEFDWSEYVTESLVSSFYWGYFITQVPGGWLAERYGGKQFLGFSIFASSVFNLFIPIAARAHYVILIGLRILIGLVQGPSLGTVLVMWTRWAPVPEQQKLVTLTVSGMAINFPAITLICEEDCRQRWPLVFYCAGILGLFWSLAWQLLVYDTPEMHPRISPLEKSYIRCNGIKSMNVPMKHHPPTPWKQLLTSQPALALMVVLLFYDFTLYTTVDTFPTYMNSGLGFDLETGNLISMVPYVACVIVVVFAGTLYDFVTTQEYISPIVARKVGNSIGSLLPAVLFFAASFMTFQDRIIAVVLIILCITLQAFQHGAGFLTNFMDLAPQHIGVLFGIANTLSTLAGTTTPFIVGYLVPNKLVSEWQNLFLLMAACFVLNALIFVICGTAGIQEWAIPPKQNTRLEVPNN